MLCAYRLHRNMPKMYVLNASGVQITHPRQALFHILANMSIVYKGHVISLSCTGIYTSFLSLQEVEWASLKSVSLCVDVLYHQMFCSMQLVALSVLQHWPNFFLGSCWAVADIHWHTLIAHVFVNVLGCEQSTRKIMHAYSAVNQWWKKRSDLSITV